METIKTILHISPFFSPNIGGVETHLSDLINALDSKNYRNIILTYSPLSTSHTTWLKIEKIGQHSKVYRFPWIGGNLFHKLEKFPIINFLYITPYLLIRSLIFIYFHKTTIDTIHSHGLNGAIIGNVIKKLFKIKKHIVSIYSTYDNVPLNSFSTKLLVKVLNSTDTVLTQSNSSIKQLTEIGVNPNIVHRYYHWVDLNLFHPANHLVSSRFQILFVGRLVPQKNALMLASLAKSFSNIDFTFVGTGPEYSRLLKKSQNQKNIILIGDVDYSQLAPYYQRSDLLCVPSKYQEGWGRIIAESIASGTPVLSTNLGGTTEVANNTVAIYTYPNSKNFSKYIKQLSSDPNLHRKLKKNCRQYAINHYSQKNIDYITQHY